MSTAGDLDDAPLDSLLRGGLAITAPIIHCCCLSPDLLPPICTQHTYVPGTIIRVSVRWTRSSLATSALYSVKRVCSSTYMAHAKPLLLLL